MSNIVSKIPTVARVLLGLIFAVFGLNGFLHFIPTPPMSGPAGAFGSAMFATGYLFQLLKSVEVIAGFLLLSNRFVPLALALLAPVVVNIVAFHTFLAPLRSLTKTSSEVRPSRCSRRNARSSSPWMGWVTLCPTSSEIPRGN